MTDIERSASDQEATEIVAPKAGADKSRFGAVVARVKAGAKPGSRLFWIWVGYQAVKGALTLSLIWIPLLFLWLRG